MHLSLSKCPKKVILKSEITLELVKWSVTSLKLLISCRMLTMSFCLSWDTHQESNVPLSLSMQPVTVTCMPVAAVSTWSCTSCQAAGVVGSASTVVTTQQDATATTARRDTTGTWPSLFHTAELAKVTDRTKAWICMSKVSLKEPVFFSYCVGIIGICYTLIFRGKTKSLCKGGLRFKWAD